MDPGQTLTVAGAEATARAGAAADLHLRGVQLRATDAQVLAVTSRGAPALTLARRGKGAVIVCAYPIELLAAEVPDGLGDDDPVWAIYRLVRDTAGVRPAVDLDSSLLTRGILTGEAGGILVATNHSAGDLTLPLRADAEVNGLRVRIVDSAAEERPGAAARRPPQPPATTSTSPRGGAAIVTWKRAPHTGAAAGRRVEAGAWFPARGKRGTRRLLSLPRKHDGGKWGIGSGIRSGTRHTNMRTLILIPILEYNENYSSCFRE